MIMFIPSCDPKVRTGSILNRALNWFGIVFLRDLIVISHQRPMLERHLPFGKHDLGTSKTRYSAMEIYWIAFDAFRTIRSLGRARKGGELDRRFMERIMLAVTEVNGCPLCSYAHTKMALESGMSLEETRNMLAGTKDDIPSDELAAILFAQHYAETRGNPSEGSWRRIVDIYGLTKASGILGSIRTIMLGNAIGIPFGSLINRVRGKSDPNSAISYELGMTLSTPFIVPASLMHAVLSTLKKKPMIDF